jgi:hypothetical protein
MDSMAKKKCGKRNGKLVFASFSSPLRLFGVWIAFLFLFAGHFLLLSLTQRTDFFFGCASLSKKTLNSSLYDKSQKAKHKTTTKPENHH